MGRLKNTATVEVHPGLYLKRANSHNAWHCYFRMNGQQFRKSTKTDGLAEAKAIALNWFQTAKQKAYVGRSIERVSFEKLANTYLEHIESFPKHSFHKDIMHRHLLPFFASFKDVSKLRTADIQDYFTYRRAKSSVLPQSLNRENTVLRQALKFATDRDWLSSPIIIEHFSERLTRKRRSHFTGEEYVRLCHTAKKRIKQLEGQALQTMALRHRKLLYDYIKFSISTGIRVDESKSLTWRDVNFENRTASIEHTGKTKTRRTIWIRPTGIMALERLKARRLEYLSKSNIHSINPNEKVFCIESGKTVASFKKGFNALLEAAGFEYVDRSRKHTLTSLRHSYATFRLTTKRAKRASIKSLSLQMGTSIRMIEKYYGHDQIHDYEEELAG
jgi:integrase